jgi:hypothetical protein
MAEAIWRVNVTNRTVTAEAVLESWRRLGGRGLILRILLDCAINPTEFAVYMGVRFDKTPAFAGNG